jgi:hypothetical protein
MAITQFFQLEFWRSRYPQNLTCLIYVWKCENTPRTSADTVEVWSPLVLSRLKDKNTMSNHIRVRRFLPSAFLRISPKMELRSEVKAGNRALANNCCLWLCFKNLFNIHLSTGSRTRKRAVTESNEFTRGEDEGEKNKSFHTSFSCKVVHTYSTVENIRRRDVKEVTRYS